MSGNPKLFSTYSPWAKDQNIPTVMGAPAAGQSAYAFGVASLASPALVTLPYAMENATYFVFINNITHPGVATVAAVDKTPTTITVTGATTSDVLEVLIVGTLKGQKV